MYIYFVTKRANERGYFSHNLFYNQKHYDYTLVYRDYSTPLFLLHNVFL